LLGKALLHQKHHRVGLGDRIVGTVLMNRHSGNDDRALSRFDSQAAAGIDDHNV
jgi:hypothetical protein